MLLVVNSGSSSVKLAVFDDGLGEVAAARVSEIATGGPADHADALAAGFAELAAQGISPGHLAGAAHRVVHGGAGLTATCRVTDAIEAAIDACARLAPLHNPANLAGIRAMRRLRPGLPQFAAFDTAFHAANPAVSTTYALPQAERDRGLRRYGFHGLSYAAIVRIVQEMASDTAPKRLLSFHLGNGASACAIVDGRSVASTMGYSPLDGLTMGTRPGGLDPAVVLDLVERYGLNGAADLLNRHSGLLALGGASDMRALHAAGTSDAAFAVDHFCHWATRLGGSLIAAMSGLDAITFSGGIGENDGTVRSKILNGLAFMGVDMDLAANAANARVLHNAASRVKVWIIPTEEERQIALEVRALRAAEPGEQR